MTQPTAYQHVPAFLARRFPAIAELEDNPLYLRATGKAYCSQRSKRRFWQGQWQVAVFILYVLCIFIINRLEQLLPVNYYMLLLVAWIAGFFILAHLFAETQQGEATQAMESGLLEREWLSGRHLHLYMTRMTGRDIYWAWIGANFVHGFTGFITAIFCLPFCALLAPFLQHWNSQIAIPWSYVPAIFAAILIVGLQCLAVGFATQQLLVRNEFDFAGLRDTRRSKLTVLSGLTYFFTFAALILPGILLGWLGAQVLIHYGIFEDAFEAFPTFILSWLYFLGNLPFSLLVNRFLHRRNEETIEARYRRAIRRLTEMQEARPESEIFGEQL